MNKVENMNKVTKCALQEENENNNSAKDRCMECKPSPTKFKK